jgi:hypothetical protein
MVSEQSQDTFASTPMCTAIASEGLEIAIGAAVDGEANDIVDGRNGWWGASNT